AWFPSVIASTPAVYSLRAMRLVTPTPSAAFSAFATTRSTTCRARSSGRCISTARRPGAPKMSAMKRIRTAGSYGTRPWLQERAGSRGLADLHGDVVPGVGRVVRDRLVEQLGQVDDLAQQGLRRVHGRAHVDGQALIEVPDGHDHGGQVARPDLHDAATRLAVQDVGLDADHR